MSGFIKRYNVLDFIRGIALINMILYHGIWDMVYIFGADIPWYTERTGYIWQQMICHTFIILSGFCWSLGGKKLKRAVIVLAASVVISFVTIAAMPENTIMFGVLSLIGSGMLFMIPLRKRLKKINPYLGLCIFVLLFVITRNTAAGIIGIGESVLFEIPEELYSNLLTAYIGFPPADFVSEDYFPLIPWMFLYVSGYFLYRIFDKGNLMRFLRRSLCKPVEGIGRYSLLIYMLHQPLIYAVLYLIY